MLGRGGLDVSSVSCAYCVRGSVEVVGVGGRGGFVDANNIAGDVNGIRSVQNRRILVVDRMSD